MIETTVCPDCEGLAEVLERDVLESTDGPVEHARILCVRRHPFFLPVAMLATAGSGSVRETDGSGMPVRRVGSVG